MLNRLGNAPGKSPPQASPPCHSLCKVASRATSSTMSLVGDLTNANRSSNRPSGGKREVGYGITLTMFNHNERHIRLHVNYSSNCCIIVHVSRQTFRTNTVVHNFHIKNLFKYGSIWIIQWTMWWTRCRVVLCLSFSLVYILYEIHSKLFAISFLTTIIAAQWRVPNS